MPTIRVYVKKSASLALVIIAFVVSVIIVTAIIFNLLPNKIHLGLVLFTAYYIKEIGIAVALAILFFLTYTAFRVFKKAESPKQEFIKMAPAILIWLCVLIYAADFLEEFFDDTNCQHYNYNEKLNGGTKTINGKKYTINLCGNGGSNSRFFGDGLDKVKLEILNEQGEVLAKRHYSVFWDGVPSHNPIELHSDHITYYDDADQYDSQRTISMPPTIIDWIRARISLLD